MFLAGVGLWVLINHFLTGEQAYKIENLIPSVAPAAFRYVANIVGHLAIEPAP